MKKFSITLFALAATFAMAASADASTIDFASCTSVRLSHAGTNCSNLPSSASYALYSWTENGNTVSAVSGNQATSTTQTTDTTWQWTTTDGNLEPSLKQTQQSGGNSGYITVTPSNGSIELNSFDMGTVKNSGTDQYEIVGFNSTGGQVYSTGFITEPTSTTSSTLWTTVSNPDALTPVAYVEIYLQDTGAQPDYLDNLNVSDVPEPGSLVLLGSGFGLLGLGLFLRQRNTGDSKIRSFWFKLT